MTIHGEFRDFIISEPKQRFYATVLGSDCSFTVSVSDDTGAVLQSFTRPTDYGAKQDGIKYAMRRADNVDAEYKLYLSKQQGA